MYTDSSTVEASNSICAIELNNDLYYKNLYKFRAVISVNRALHGEESSTVIDRVQNLLIGVIRAYESSYALPDMLRLDGQNVTVVRGSMCRKYRYPLEKFYPIVSIEGVSTRKIEEEYYKKLEGGAYENYCSLGKYIPLRSSELPDEVKNYFFSEIKEPYTHLMAFSDRYNEREMRLFSVLLVVAFMQDLVSPERFLKVVKKGKEYIKEYCDGSDSDVKRRMGLGVKVIQELYYRPTQANLKKIIDDRKKAVSLIYFFKQLVYMTLFRDDISVNEARSSVDTNRREREWSISRKRGVVDEISSCGKEHSLSLVAALQVVFGFQVIRYQWDMIKNKPNSLVVNDEVAPIHSVALLEHGSEYYLLYNGNKFQFS